MKPIKSLTDEDYKVMSIIWAEGGEAPARRIHEVLADQGYSRAATYQIITRCIAKGAIERIEPGYVCHALFSEKEAQSLETKRLIDRVFGGSAERLLVALVNPGATSEREIERLRHIVWEAYSQKR